MFGKTVNNLNTFLILLCVFTKCIFSEHYCIFVKVLVLLCDIIEMHFGKAQGMLRTPPSLKLHAYNHSLYLNIISTFVLPNKFQYT